MVRVAAVDCGTEGNGKEDGGLERSGRICTINK